MMKHIVGLLLLLVVAKIVFINSISPILTSHNATVVTTTTVVAATDTKEIVAVVIDDSSLAHRLEQGLCDTYESYPLVCGNNINIIQTVPYIVSPINGYLMWEKYGSITDNEDDDEYIQYFKESKAFFELQEFVNFNEARMIGGFKYTQCKRKMSHINKWIFFCPRVICGNKNEEFKTMCYAKEYGGYHEENYCIEDKNLAYYDYYNQKISHDENGWVFCNSTGAPGASQQHQLQQSIVTCTSNTTMKEDSEYFPGYNNKSYNFSNSCLAAVFGFDEDQCSVIDMNNNAKKKINKERAVDVCPTKILPVQCIFQDDGSTIFFTNICEARFSGIIDDDEVNCGMQLQLGWDFSIMLYPCQLADWRKR